MKTKLTETQYTKDVKIVAYLTKVGDVMIVEEYADGDHGDCIVVDQNFIRAMYYRLELERIGTSPDVVVEECCEGGCSCNEAEGDALVVEDNVTVTGNVKIKGILYVDEIKALDGYPILKRTYPDEPKRMTDG